MKYFADQFQLFFLALATLNSCIILLHWQHNWHPCRQLAANAFLSLHSCV